MPTIYLETIIKAPVDRVFDLARSIDLHMISTKETNEKAIAGKTSGLINLNETVTWRAKHFGIYQKLSVRITRMQRPFLFEDKMLSGAFKSMEHVHRFEEFPGGTKMFDEFTFSAPLGPLGKLAERLFLTKYMKRFLVIRNQELKDIAESEKWKKLLTIN
ncbi:SRPBCC family protein [Sphingobacterium hungaricum]